MHSKPHAIDPTVLTVSQTQSLGSPKLAVGGNLWMGPFLFTGQQRQKFMGLKESQKELVWEGPLEVSGPTSCSVHSWLKICNRFLRASPFKF